MGLEERPLGGLGGPPRIALQRRPTPTLHLLRPSLLWALGHGLLALFFFRGGLLRALAGVPPEMHLPLWGGFVVQSLALGLAMWLATLPLLALRRHYAWAAPLVISLATVGLYVDSLLFESLGFHVNRLVLQVAMQPGALAETGLSHWEVFGLCVAMAVFLGVEIVAGRLFFLRFARRLRSAVALAALVALVWTGERVGSAVLSFYGGQGVVSAATTLPLQPPVRMNNFLRKVTGKKPQGELLVKALPSAGAPMGALDAEEVAFERTPDVLFILVESLRADFFRPDVMPRLWERAHASGRIFPRHYSGASSTHFSLFSIFYGLDCQRRDATIGAGHTPLLFPALKANGYDLSLIAASSVDWMGLRETVFRDVGDGLQTHLPGNGHERDAEMIRRAEAKLRETAPDQPLFLFLFFIGSHFNYSYPDDAEIFTPVWDGAGSLAAARVPPEHLKNRAFNSVWEVDRKIDDFLRTYEEIRGGKPLVIVTSDHGEEFRERGRVGHGSDVTVEQIHVPLVIFDEALPPGEHDGVSGHVDLVPTVFGLLGDEHPPSLYSDGMSLQDAPRDRYAMASVGWEPRFAIVGKELKVRFFSMDAGMGSIQLTDPFDQPLPDAQARFAKEGRQMLRRLRGGLQTSGGGGQGITLLD